MKELGYMIKPAKLNDYFKSVLKIEDNSYWFNLPPKLFDDLGIDTYDIEFEFKIDSDNKIVLVGPKVNRGPTNSPTAYEVTNLV